MAVFNSGYVFYRYGAGTDSNHFHLNPMTPIIIAYRDILYYQKVPKLGTLTQGIIFSIILLIVGWNVFGHLKKHFAEEM